MTILIAGTVRVPPENLARFQPHMEAMLAASRAEDGCLTYSYAVDVAEPGLVRVFEAWRDQAAIDAHFQTAHMAEWRAAWPQFGVSDRNLSLYEVASERPL
ncbi:putative quinol monooxygenase [Phenylobacterium sp.]|uniref:putative quinol monooxygenase n=1 Tax=Phenylobacterium sp. TaxID=1871053 RepID=UPI0025DBAE5B|nr:putative quinol monooxygenase [Phenylobacterium sp.]MBX3485912.1 antibiotic biosynthesis monooxygenase [Phenylobacterium sp.]MCW5758230.1 antibiotic biosynthesis monooxygenase [Phenylobacterium sp.]